MELADVTIPDAQVLLLARKLVAVGHAETADRLTVAYARGAEVVALIGDERDAILAVLDDPPPPLCELRAVLLAQHVWRRREGL